MIRSIHEIQCSEAPMYSDADRGQPVLRVGETGRHKH